MNAKVTNARGESLDVRYSATNVHINNSYLVGKDRIPEWVKVIKSFGEQNGYTYSRSNQSWINEWKAHNLLYKCGVSPNRTRDVDLNEDETSIRELGYSLLSILYI